MSAALRTAAEAAHLPTVPGCSTRALRVVLSRIAQLAQQDGSLRYGLRVSKLADLVLYSPATVKRAQAALVAAGFLERVRIGGGRSSTHWRLRVEALGGRPPETSRPVDNRPAGYAARAGSSPGMNRQPVRREPGQGRGPGFPSRINERPLAAATQPQACEHGEPRGSTYCPLCRHSIKPQETQPPRVLSRRRKQ